MDLMSRIQTGRQAAPRRVMLYTVHGIGKSTFGALAPNPIFIQTEDGLGNLDCARFPLAEAFDNVLAAIMELYSAAHDFQTVVVDSLDWLERMIWAKVVRDRGPQNKTRFENIEDYGFVRGYTMPSTIGRTFSTDSTPSAMSAACWSS